MAFIIEGLLAATGSEDEYYRWEFSRTYRLISDNLTDTEYDAVLALGISPNTPHPAYSRSVARKITASIHARYTNGATAGLLWDVVVDYGPWNPLEHSSDGNPLHQPIRYRLDPVTVERPVFLDNAGNPVVNAAGDPFDPPITQEDTEYLLTVMRNEESVDVFTLMSNSGQGQVNNAAWNGFPEKTVKVLPIKLPEKLWSQEADTLYYPMEYVFHIKFDTWTRMVVNQGFGELATVAGATVRRTIVDASGQPLTTPVMLDAMGHQLTQPINSSNIVVLSFDVQPTADFTIFDMDTLFS